MEMRRIARRAYVPLVDKRVPLAHHSGLERIEMLPEVDLLAIGQADGGTEPAGGPALTMHLHHTFQLGQYTWSTCVSKLVFGA